MRVHTALSTADALAPDLKALSTLPMPVIEAPPPPVVPSSSTSSSHTVPSVEAPNQPREYAYRLSALLLTGDVVIAAIAIFAGLAFREWQRSDQEVLQLNQLRDPFFWSLGGAAVYAWLMAMLKTYETTNLYKLQLWAKNHLKAIALWSIATWACVGLFHLQSFSPRIGVLYCTLTLTGFLTLWRLISFVSLIQPRVKEAVSSRVIVIGWNKNSTHLRKAMRRDLSQLDEIVGCVPMPGGSFATPPPAEVAVLGDYSALPQLVKKCQAHSVILAEVTCSSREIQHLVAFCQRELLGFKMIPEYFPALNSGLQVQTVSGVPLLSVSHLPLDRMINRAVKRTIDIIGGVIGLILSALIIPWFCMMVYLESPGPVIYRQRRTSRGGRTFFIYKIRSMRLDAETKSGAVWCKQEDNRRLKIGTFMRKTNIDELPQFWNVLKGDMSLVGPRPERPELIEKFKDQIPNYNARHEVRAGLTGWAQINGLRGDTDLGKRIEADLYYLENWSVMLDLYCIFATFFKIKNAH
jgi:exopolysaccharide biosynthesis polyprenyl glycosylphosphotransferase